MIVLSFQIFNPKLRIIAFLRVDRIYIDFRNIIYLKILIKIFLLSRSILFCILTYISFPFFQFLTDRAPSSNKFRVEARSCNGSQLFVHTLYIYIYIV